jgi:hypothetical protein
VRHVPQGFGIKIGLQFAVAEGGVKRETFDKKKGLII